MRHHREYLKHAIHVGKVAILFLKKGDIEKGILTLIEMMDNYAIARTLAFISGCNENVEEVSEFRDTEIQNIIDDFINVLMSKKSNYRHIW